MSNSDKQFKKSLGQHFLRDQSIADAIVAKIPLNQESNVFEIGGGDGFLTKTILQQPLKRLWVFEIDPQWGALLKKINDARLTVFNQDFLTVDVAAFAPYAPWILFGNLPYNITFPILYLLLQHRQLLQEAVIMIQEEVAQKIVKKSGRGYGFTSLYFQWHFEWQLLQKVPPTAFQPPPKVYSRLLYFRPKKNIPTIPHEQQFWKFIKRCFAQPRRTLKNNLMQSHLPLEHIPQETLALRAQQMNMEDFLAVWQLLHS